MHVSIFNENTITASQQLERIRDAQNDICNVPMALKGDTFVIARKLEAKDCVNEALVHLTHCVYVLTDLFFKAYTRLNMDSQNICRQLEAMRTPAKGSTLLTFDHAGVRPHVVNYGGFVTNLSDVTQFN